MFYAGIVCPPPLLIPHTNHVTANDGALLVEGSRVLYTCDDGFRFIDGSQSAYMVCNAHAEWSGIDYSSDGKEHIIT